MKVDVNHEMLAWARKAAGLKIEDAVKLLGLRDTQRASARDKLLTFESGQKPPSRSLLLDMAKRYHRPLLTFYLESPPREENYGVDFRSPSQRNAQQDAQVRALIRDIKARQSMVKSLLQDEDDTPPLSFIGSEQGREPERLLQALQNLLGVSCQEYRAQNNPRNALKLLRQQAEKAGIFVLLRGDLGSYYTSMKPDIFRGFALADDIAPFVIINHYDSIPAQSFTLLHEIVHLLLGKTGVSGSYMNNTNPVEILCNNVAGNFLLPTSEIKNVGLSPKDEMQNLRDKIGKFATQNKLSSTMIAYRAYQNSIIERTVFLNLRKHFRDLWKQNQKRRSAEQSGGPDSNKVRRSRLGDSLIAVVHRSMRSGDLTTVKAAKILGVKPRSVYRVIEAF